MAFNTIDGFTNELVTWSNGGLTTLAASNMITLAEDRIYREIRVRQMEAQTTMTITSGVVSVSSSLLEVKDIHIDSSPDQALQRKSPDWIYQKYPDRGSSGVPKYFAREGSNFIFGSYPDDNYVVVINYWDKPATSVNGTLTGILASSPGLLLNAAMSEGEAYLGRDQRVQLFEAKYQQLKEIVMKAPPEMSPFIKFYLEDIKKARREQEEQAAKTKS